MKLAQGRHIDGLKNLEGELENVTVASADAAAASERKRRYLNHDWTCPVQESDFVFCTCGSRLEASSDPIDAALKGTGPVGDIPEGLKRKDIDPIEATLKDREKTHGKFKNVAQTAQRLKDTFRWAGIDHLNAEQREALDLVASKIARILCGDPNYADNWHDIAGYARLGEKACMKENGE